jgi:hypothetical protein
MVIIWRFFDNSSSLPSGFFVDEMALFSQNRTGKKVKKLYNDKQMGIYSSERRAKSAKRQSRERFGHQPHFVRAACSTRSKKF